MTEYDICAPAATAPGVALGKGKHNHEKLITLTDSAREKVLHLMKKEGKEGWGLRIEAVPGGCAGYVYALDFNEQPSKDDVIIEDKDVKVFIDNASRELLKGANVDYIDSLMGSGFIVTNPSVKRTCGCGHSFG